METIYQAIYETSEYTLTIVYIPLADGAIEIVSVDIQKRPASHWQAREQSRRKTPQKR